MIKIVTDNKIPFLKGVFEGFAQVCYFPGRDIRKEHVLDADALIVRTRTKCNKQLLDGTSVKYIATATIGYDHLDVGYLKENGIRWSNAPGCNSGSVKQYIASALAYISSLSGKRFNEISLGIIGVGYVGKKVEHMANILGMNVFLNDPPRERMEGSGSFTDMDRLLKESDIVTMHVPLNKTGQDKSLYLANEILFRKMKKGSWFINTSRGEIVHSRALIEVLRNGHLAGTVLDVWENEPYIDMELLKLAGISTPHIAGYSLDGKANGTAQSVSAISRHFGLGIDDWYPETIPPPSNGIMQIEGNHPGLDQLIRKVFLHCYDIKADSSRLKLCPDNFEKFRDNYPPRREFGAYKLKFQEHSDNFIDTFRKLGFTI